LSAFSCPPSAVCCVLSDVCCTLSAAFKTKEQTFFGRSGLTQSIADHMMQSTHFQIY
jgi:hypothetical protein